MDRMDDPNSRSNLVIPVIFLVLGFGALLALLITFAKQQSHTKQPWGIDNSTQVNTGPRAPSMDADIYGIGIIPTYEGTIGSAQGLVNRWYNFADRVGPHVAGAIYALFPDLQTQESISYYNLSAGMMTVLNAIQSYLDSPQMFKTLDDVNRILSPIAIKIFDEDVGIKPQSGLYNNPQLYGWGTDVI